MSLVLDSSVALAWLFSDEVTPATQNVFDTVLADRAWVPSLWRLEIANALQMGVRRGRISAEFRDASLIDLALLAIAVDPETDTFAWSATLRLAERYQLTLYDAAYLELAQRLNVPLATLDQELRTAGSALGLVLLGS
ncbi:type II toxin-antitoxin system VapC family toxin [Gloeobacter morelensis]|uniref:Type II toxin-antitoxin system VapC family toxin n=1 Tax=Gloeobacter morelensis MG652769 TaxID=2781736 RepID=A0ABY3PPR4_9CYAN|nr:type II toxin-antitoxin system VapC family toxin [Gloeobacter morelensis]UFP95681.1 type II toxin-antitoxin system VapC family toxin [Gloeobacter morelensis MG652769]